MDFKSQELWPDKIAFYVVVLPLGEFMGFRGKSGSQNEETQISGFFSTKDQE